MKKIITSATGRIAIALLLGITFGLIANYFDWVNFIIHWIKPVGSAFIKMLRAIAIPLIIISLTKGIIELKDLSQLSKLGGKAAIYYLITTLIATSWGLLLANLCKPGTFISPETKVSLIEQFQFTSKHTEASDSEGFLLDLIPSNLLETFTNNEAMLSIIFITIIFAIAILKSEEKVKNNLGQLFSSLNQVIMKVIDFIMLLAVPSVFSLMAALVVETPKSDLLLSMLIYVGVVIFGLAIMVFIFYPLLVNRLTGFSGKAFLKGISKAQLVGISSSSSAATLPVTLDCVRDNLKVSNETASFILPIGATCNMDGTGMYQAVAALFIAQLYGLELSFMAQIGIVMTATLGSIGAAAVPGGGIVMLTIVLEQAGLPLSGLGLILALDRPLDMLRTAVNITSDAAGALILDSSRK